MEAGGREITFYRFYLFMFPNFFTSYKLIKLTALTDKIMENKVELSSLVSVLAQVKKEGHKLDFRVTDDGVLCTMDGKQQFTPDQVRIVNFYRFEGESNPDDMAILYVLETTTGAKGTISDSYGLYADETVDAFMKQVTDLGKNIDSRV